VSCAQGHRFLRMQARITGPVDVQRRAVAIQPGLIEGRPVRGGQCHIVTSQPPRHGGVKQISFHWQRGLWLFQATAAS